FTFHIKKRCVMNEIKPLFIQIYSIHGLIRSKNLELGRDADTGGQTKYVVELCTALSLHPAVGKVELVTRWISDKRISPDYAVPVEQVNDKFSIVRIQCGGGRYIRKELLWDHLEEFVDRSIKHIKSSGRLPDIIHSHYADAGFVCMELTKFFGIPMIHTGHSLGKPKLERLTGSGLLFEDIEERYNITHRIEVEESVLNYAEIVITSTRDEKDLQYAEYRNKIFPKFHVIPPGIELDRFYPYTEQRPFSEQMQQVRSAIREQLWRFFLDMNRPLILTICRPDTRKNIGGLITAYGEDKELQQMANLAIFAGIRKDIQTMSDNERDVLTEMLLLMDKYDLYGKMAIPKRHDVEFEIPELYRIAAETRGVFVNPAFTENFGITLLEAAASGLPVVATDHGGPRDIISNLQCGTLVKIEHPATLGDAIKKILYDQSEWKRYSENGTGKIAEYYSWSAHADRYLAAIVPYVGTVVKEEKTFTHVGKKFIKTRKLLVTDIDNTLLGDPPSLDQLFEFIQHHREDIGFGIATGRTIDSAVEILRENGCPMPDFFITSVGAEVYYTTGTTVVPSTGWASHIDYRWNRKGIEEVLRQFSFLSYQEEKTQRPFKISYYANCSEEDLNAVRNELSRHKLRCKIIYSHDQFFDLLPLRASKGLAVRYLAYRWNISLDHVIVAGDSGNDEDMLTGETLGIVVGNHSPELEKLRGRRRIYFADGSYAGGILEGIRAYRFAGAQELEKKS
ncbi:MAG: HAD-IIB family hydrolase, partial [Bacteroidota bacterium]